MKIIHDRADLAAVAAELGPGSDWHEPDEYGLTGRFDGTDGDLDNAGFWPMDVSRASTGHTLGYDRDGHGRPRRGEMAIIISHDTWEKGIRYRGPDVFAVNVADLLGWAVTAERLAVRVAQLEAANKVLREAIAIADNLAWGNALIPKSRPDRCRCGYVEAGQAALCVCGFMDPPTARHLIGPPSAHLDGPCADTCYEDEGELP